MSGSCWLSSLGGGGWKSAFHCKREHFDKYQFNFRRLCLSWEISAYRHTLLNPICSVNIFLLFFRRKRDAQLYAVGNWTIRGYHSSIKPGTGLAVFAQQTCLLYKETITEVRAFELMVEQLSCLPFALMRMIWYAEHSTLVHTCVSI